MEKKSAFKGGVFPGTVNGYPYWFARVSVTDKNGRRRWLKTSRKTREEAEALLPVLIKRAEAIGAARKSRASKYALPGEPGITRRRHAPTARQMYIYIIRDNDLSRVKIGISEDPHRRMQNLKSASGLDLKLLAYWPGTDYDESVCQATWDRCHLAGEWFRPDEEMNDWIAERVKTFAEGSQ